MTSKMHRQSWPQFYESEDKPKTINKKLSTSIKNSLAKEINERDLYLDQSDEKDYQSIPCTVTASSHLKILPTKPIQESEYADKHCFKVSTRTNISVNKTSHITIKQQPHLEEFEYISKQSTFPAIKGPPVNRKLKPSFLVKSIDTTKVNELKNPLPPPRSQQPLQRKHKPLPPEPKESSQLLPSTSERNLSLLFTEELCNLLGKDCTISSSSRQKRRHEGSSKCQWYIRDYNRQEAEEVLLQEHSDGTFLVRDHSMKSNNEPYVLVIFYGKKVYNIKIHFLEDTQQYTLGSGQRKENKFDSVEEMIEFYKKVPMILIDGKEKSHTQGEQCYLTNPVQLSRRYFLP
ncbi:cytokine-dependent hematopoietic cell linker isoform X2 [Microcaecilia unicolor]|uniref:Cytokine-dependent hematopoietic cell linker isoform X2 n=1 Tax=Microcaecilia unicolor TaxID=1415580 RepID=A0A6P7WYZ0_9AMPH|nr:cytokine-dependent hematopoietic cell linker isoform X2 [Microcaecilia unicolor]